ncbi:copine-8-like [Contarinia nasturtii]|uniref:copine-8-like n=1 Tax=Contarinia nasturtii TaxID=265458 RepID=UPI0012D45540|nr:copine-8-like [Contarinia nasturtii]
MANPVHINVGSMGILRKPKEKNVHVESDEELLLQYEKSFKTTSKIELTISCKNLYNTHIIRGTSDPFCVVSVKRPWQSRYVEIDRTEIIENSLNPQWFKKIVLDYSFEAIQHVEFEIRDMILDEHSFLGRYTTTLGALVSSHGRQVVGKIPIAKIGGEIIRNNSEIVIVTEEDSQCKQVIEIQFAAENLPKRKWFRSNDPFLVISRINEDDTYSVVTRTKVAKSSQNPEWKPLKIRVGALCHDDFDKKIKIECFSDRGNGHYKLIGACITSINELNEISQEEASLTLINEEKQKSDANYVNSGTLKVLKNSMAEEISFLDYIQGGVQMHFAVAIDFTSSNGVHTDTKSLHYLSEEEMNNYELALRGVGETLQHYDSDQLFPAFGFGAKLPCGTVSFQFPLNNNPEHPYCSGVDEILENYKAQLNAVELHEPTNFAPVINDTIEIAKKFQDGKHYFVLLIVTDGIISDMTLTKAAIIEASKLPISIIIVGVGDADFNEMKELDADDEKLNVDGRFAERDIVQFVPMNKFLTEDAPNDKPQTDLAEEVLAEIPEQFTSYMKSRGFEPQEASSLQQKRGYTLERDDTQESQGED